MKEKLAAVDPKNLSKKDLVISISIIGAMFFISCYQKFAL
jgi:hypothetical protein